MPHRKKILLSDDDENFSILLQDFLHKHGDFHVFRAKDADATAEMLHRHRPHILLLDFMLPRKGGLSFLRQLRHSGHTISTIFMTAKPTQKVVQAAFDLGVTFVFPKPFSMHNMAARIHEELNRSFSSGHTDNKAEVIILVLSLPYLLR